MPQQACKAGAAYPVNFQGRLGAQDAAASVTSTSRKRTTAVLILRLWDLGYSEEGDWTAGVRIHVHYARSRIFITAPRFQPLAFA